MKFRFAALLLLIYIAGILYFIITKKETSGIKDSPEESHNSRANPKESYWWDDIEQITDTLEITDWRKYEYNRTDSLIQRFIKEKRGTFQLFKDIKEKHTYKTIQDLPKHLYTVRVNNDSLPDIIYQGPTDGEPEVLRIYLNRIDSFQLAFEDYQYCKNLKLENGLIKSFTLGNPGCCADPTHKDCEFEVIHNGPAIKFNKVREVAFHRNTEKPKSFLSNPKSFKLPDNKVYLRASSAEVNEPYNETAEMHGNIVATFSANIQGKILATEKDKRGQDWLFVELPFRKSQPDSSIFYTENFNRVFIQGWLPAKDLNTKN